MQRGDVSIFFTSTMLMIIIMTALVVGMIAASTLKRTAGSEFPAQAFYAADTGIEHSKANYDWSVDLDALGNLPNEACDIQGVFNLHDESQTVIATYEVDINDTGGCPNMYADPKENLAFSSVGKAAGSLRKVELSF